MVCFPHISWGHNIITEVTSQLVSRNVGEERRSWKRSCPPSWRGRWRRRWRAGRRWVRACGTAPSRWRLLQAVTHHNKRVKAKSCIYHKLWSEIPQLQNKYTLISMKCKENCSQRSRLNYPNSLFIEFERQAIMFHWTQNHWKTKWTVQEKQETPRGCYLLSPATWLGKKTSTAS